MLHGGCLIIRSPPLPHRTAPRSPFSAAPPRFSVPRVPCRDLQSAARPIVENLRIGIPEACRQGIESSESTFMPTLERALQIAVNAHAGQKDKAGGAYIFHPIRVMSRCRTPEAMIVGLLHDVVEDTSVTFDDLEEEGFSTAVLDALRLLTHDKAVPYETYIEHIQSNPIATEAKLADLEDNMDIRRSQEVDEKAATRFKKYLAAYRSLGGGSR